MAFAETITHRTVMGDKKVIFGTFTAANADTTGTLTTGLTRIENFQISGLDLAPAGGTSGITAGTDAGDLDLLFADPTGACSGYWMAMGY